MTVHANDPAEARPPTVGTDAQEREYERYGGVWTTDGEYIVYDVDADGAWIQSDVSVSLEATR